jgi:hypothetical protein
MRYLNLCKLALVCSIVVLPTAITGALLTSFGKQTDILLIRIPGTIALLSALVAYIGCLVSMLLYAFLTRTSALMTVGLATLLVIALFMLTLPENETGVGWRLIDVGLLGTLAVLVVVQSILLRREIRNSARTQ